GVLLGGPGTDAIGPRTTLLVGFVLATSSMMVLALLADSLGLAVPFGVVLAVTVVWAAALWSFSPPMQTWLLTRAEGMESAVLALNVSGMYLGFALAGLIGGVVLAFGGPAAVPWASAALLASGAILMAVSIIVAERREGSRHADR
ncbi:MAG: hypothetical protein L0G99_15170, partial [Propionibacteriales bacterium]|nr:hypothetical protein [Propionibacteriales bacterium]